MAEKDCLMIYSDTGEISDSLRLLAERLNLAITQNKAETESAELVLHEDSEGLRLESKGQIMRCDYTQMLPRLRQSNLSQELLVRAAKIKKTEEPWTAIDATAGLGEDSLLLAASGFYVNLYERNPIIALLLKDALHRASENPQLSEIVNRMAVFEADSMVEMQHLAKYPDVIFLDPMFPTKYKNSLAKKKFQLLHHLEVPCQDEEGLLQAAIAAGPRKIIIKRPLKGPYLGSHKPDYTLKGKAVRYDCILIHG